MVIDKEYAEELIDKYLIPKLNGNYNKVVAILNAGKRIAEIVGDRLGLEVDHVKCKRIVHPLQPDWVRIEGKKSYGDNPLFVDDTCCIGTTIGGLKELYPNGKFAALVAKDHLFYPVSATELWERYVTPDDVIVGVVTDSPVKCIWEGKEYPLPVKELRKDVRPKPIGGFAFYSTKGYHTVTI
jgi:hypothetical protein